MIRLEYLFTREGLIAVKIHIMIAGDRKNLSIPIVSKNSKQWPEELIIKHRVLSGFAALREITSNEDQIGCSRYHHPFPNMVEDLVEDPFLRVLVFPDMEVGKVKPTD